MRQSRHIARGAAALGLSSAVAHGLSVAALPALALLFTPGEFGAAAELLAAMAVLASIAGCKIESAVALPASDHDAVRLSVAAALVSVVTCLAACVVLVLTRMWDWPQNGLIAQPLVWLIPPGAFVISLAATASQLLARHDRVDVLAKAKIASSAVTAGLQLTLGAASLGTAGLVLGDWLGRVAGLCRSTLHIFTISRGQRDVITIRNSLRVAWRYRVHSAWLGSASVLDTLGLQLPVILIVGWGGDAEGGKFSMAQRAFALPVGLAAQSVAKLYMPTLARTIREQPHLTLRVVDSTQRLVLIMAGVLLLLLAIVALLPLGSINLGPWSDWHGLSSYLLPLSLLAAFQVAGSPMSQTLVATGDQRLYALWSTLRLAFVLAGLSVGNAMGQTVGAAWGLSIGGAIGYILLLTLIRARAVTAMNRAISHRDCQLPEEHER